MRQVQVFLSYRRDDSAGYARAIYDALAARLGDDRVFIDVDDIGAGQAFDEVIHQAVGQSEVLLVLIGKRWLGAAEAAPSVAGAPGAGSSTRLHQAGDLVRHEIETALAKGMRVLPLLLDGAPMPTAEQLPLSLRALATRNALAIDNSRFASDMQRLVAQLCAWLGEPLDPNTGAPSGGFGGDSGGQSAGQPGRLSAGAAAAASRRPTPVKPPAAVARWRQPALLLGVALAVAALLLGLQRLPWGPNAGDRAAPATRSTAASAGDIANTGATTSATTSTTGTTTDTRSAAATPPRAAINGRWQAELHYDWPGAQYVERFEFSGSGSALQGSASFLRVPRGLLAGVVDGQTLRFDTQSTEQLGEQTRTLTHHYQLALDGDTLRGSVQTTGGSSAHVPVEVVARRLGPP